jgi:BarA-like signal transduction histidine kinase
MCSSFYCAQKRPQLAAKRAKKAFLEFILAHQDWLSDAVEVGHMLLLALKEAHEAVLDGKLPEVCEKICLFAPSLFPSSPYLLPCFSRRTD